jgi:nitrite reductase/ring-hydroxylating ferredoxin subunit
MSNNWVRVAAVGDVETDDVIAVKVGEQEIALYNVDDKYYATSNICTHQYARLSEGFVIDGVIECPLHQGRFDIVNGKPKGAPVHVPLCTFPVKVEGNDIHVLLQPQPASQDQKGGH